MKAGDTLPYTILDTIPVTLDYQALLSAVHCQEGSDDAATIRQMMDAATHIGKPKAIYKTGYIEERMDNAIRVDGVTFSSRVLRVNLSDAHRVFAYVATCGTELEEWSEQFTDILEQFWANQIKQMALNCATRFLQEHVTTTFRPGKLSAMNPGSLEDWPIEQQEILFELIGPVHKVGVRLSDSFLMTPTKSVSGLYFPTEFSFESCLLCERENCPSRRAPYDATLHESKYS